MPNKVYTPTELAPKMRYLRTLIHQLYRRTIETKAAEFQGQISKTPMVGIEGVMSSYYDSINSDFTELLAQIEIISPAADALLYAPICEVGKTPDVVSFGCTVAQNGIFASDINDVDISAWLSFRINDIIHVSGFADSDNNGYADVAGIFLDHIRLKTSGAYNWIHSAEIGVTGVQIVLSERPLP